MKSVKAASKAWFGTKANEKLCWHGKQDIFENSRSATNNRNLENIWAYIFHKDLVALEQNTEMINQSLYLQLF